MQLFCKTARAVLLLGCEAEHGPMRFPSESSELPGLVVKVIPRAPITEQLIEKASGFLGSKDLSRHVAVNQDFSDTIRIGEEDITLYVGTIEAQHQTAQLTWNTMPTLLRAMPKDRRRLPYLKAWQVLTGALSENVKAVDLEDALKHIVPEEKS